MTRKCCLGWRAQSHPRVSRTARRSEFMDQASARAVEELLTVVAVHESAHAVVATALGLPVEEYPV